MSYLKDLAIKLAEMSNDNLTSKIYLTGLRRDISNVEAHNPNDKSFKRYLLNTATRMLNQADKFEGKYKNYAARQDVRRNVFNRYGIMTTDHGKPDRVFSKGITMIAREIASLDNYEVCSHDRVSELLGMINNIHEFTDDDIRLRDALMAILNKMDHNMFTVSDQKAINRYYEEIERLKDTFEECF